MELRVNLKENSYSIIISKNILHEFSKYYSLDRKVLVISDDNIPNIYYDEIAYFTIIVLIILINKFLGDKY